MYRGVTAGSHKLLRGPLARAPAGDAAPVSPTRRHRQPYHRDHHQHRHQPRRTTLGQHRHRHHRYVHVHVQQGEKKERVHAIFLILPARLRVLRAHEGASYVQTSSRDRADQDRTGNHCWIIGRLSFGCLSHTHTHTHLFFLHRRQRRPSRRTSSRTTWTGSASTTTRTATSEQRRVKQNSGVMKRQR